MSEAARASPRWRKVAALAVLLGGGALLATTVGRGQKEPVSIHVTLPRAVTGLRIDVRQAQKIAAHLEWAYLEQKPLSQDASLELPPSDYTVEIHAQGAGQDPGLLELHVVRGELARLVTEVR